jgi:hypothetical protein
MAAAYDASSGEKILSADELINLSLKRTGEIRKSVEDHE